MLPQNLKSRRGIALPVAIAITSVLIILSASLISIAMTSISGTSSSVNSRQAYLNARSALEYALSYYSDEGCVEDLTTVNNEYMVMNDKEGGTTDNGASFVADGTAAEDYTTYVLANYIPSTGGEPILKLIAYSRATDAFGNKGKSIHIAGNYTLNKFTSKNRITLTDIDMDTAVTDVVPPGAINLHIKQYPGQNWTPFYYSWTYEDAAGLYKNLTDNCYGLETYYKSKKNLVSGSGKGPYLYYKESSETSSSETSSFTKSSQTIPAAFTLNHNHSFAPYPWNVASRGDPLDGPVTSFAASSGGWYDATYYTDDKYVNYFNIIITKKGKVLNGPNGEWYPETQTSEMFHLWYLFESDRNIYFEFLKPGLMYRSGWDWNGLDELSDRMLVYVNNRKTTVHFKIKGIGDTGEDANQAPTNAPVINSVNVDGVSIFDTSMFYSNYSNGNAGSLPTDIYNTRNLEQYWQSNFMSGNDGRSKRIDYFYGQDNVGQSKMMYEGCGWWVANIACGEDFDMTFTYYDKSGNPTTATVNVSPNTDDEAFVVVDPARTDGSSIISRLTERKACDYIDLDYKSYTTIKVKTSKFDTAVAPYLDYQSKKISTTAKRQLTEKIDEVRSSYLLDDYEEDSFNKFQDVLNRAVDLINDSDVKEDSVYLNMIDEIDKAVQDLKKHTKVVSREAYNEYEKLVNKCTSIVTAEQREDGEKLYDVTAFSVFIGPSGEYVKAKALIDSGEILNKEGGSIYTTSMVYELKNALQAEYDILESHKLVKTEINNAIKEAENYLKSSSRYKPEYVDKLRDALESAKTASKNGPNQEKINQETEALKNAITEYLANPNIEINTKSLTNLISDAEKKLENKVNCTDDTYTNLQAVVNEANDLVIDFESTQDSIDKMYDKLLKAYNEYEVMKPGYGSSSGNSVSTDALLAENRIRVWVKGMLPGTVIRTYQRNESGGAVVADSPFEVTGFTMQLYKDDRIVGTYSVSNMSKINGQGLAYQDVTLNSFNKVSFAIVTNQNELGEVNPSTGRHEILSTKTFTFSSADITVTDMSDGNLVFDLSSLIMPESGSAEDYKAKVEKSMLCELFIAGTPNAVVEVTGADGEKADYNTIKEGPYLVARYVYNSNSKAQLRYYSIDNKEYLYTDSFDSQAGQYVVKVDETSKTDRSVLKINIPYNSTTIKGSDTAFVGVKVNGSDPVEAFYDGTQYVYTAPFNGEVDVQIYRQYGDDGKQVVETGHLKCTSAGEINVTYTTDNEIKAAYTNYKFVTISYRLISVKGIYPKYSSSSGSGSTIAFSSVGELNGIVSSTFADELLTAPKSTSAMVLKTKQFEYSVPAGKKIIWIDTDNSYLNKNTPYVYVWNRNDQPLNGNWPGTTPTRVEGSSCFYVLVNSDAYGCIISLNSGSRKIGGDPSNSNNIYIPTSNASYIIIDGDVLSSAGYTHGGSRYRTKVQSNPPTYTVPVPGIDVSSMDATDLRMPFVGGSKIRMVNQSYYDSYGTSVLTGGTQYLSDGDFKSENSAGWIVSSNLFGGTGGNQSSMNRVGDTSMSLIYDWYERKIPVDQSDEYTFQVKSVKYVSSKVPAGKKWYDDGYVTDTVYAQQVQDVYGNVWLVLKSDAVQSNTLTDMNLYTVDPEVVQVEDDQAIYFKKTSTLVSVEISTSGVGGGANYVMTDDSERPTECLYAKIPAKTPFLTMTATYSDGTTKVFKTSLQGGDLLMFDASMNAGKGGWDNYVPPSVELERALYSAQALYYGKVLAKSYNADGNPHNYGNAGSYWFPEGMDEHIVKRYFTDGQINSSGRNADINEVNRWLNAYTNLYVAMANARAYIPGRNYPEYKRNGSPNIFDSGSIAALQSKLDQAVELYKNRYANITEIESMAEDIIAAIDNIEISTEDKVPIIFYDTTRLYQKGASFSIRYSTTPEGAQITSDLQYTNTEGFPIIFIQPDSSEEAIYKVEFIIHKPNGEDEVCKMKDQVDLVDGAWVFVHQPADPPDRELDTSYWVKNTSTDYRQISRTEFTQGSSGEVCAYDMIALRASVHDSVPVAYSEADAKDLKYRPMTLYFKYDTKINTYDTAKSYTIKAGAYSFDETCINTAAEISAGRSGPFVYSDVGSGMWKPRLDLFSDAARAYFTDPVNYGEYTTELDGEVVDATALDGWVTQAGDKLTITAGAHAANKTVNLTVNDGSFAENRLMSYFSTGKLYFRWQGNKDLKVYNDVTFTADEVSMALSGKLDGTSYYGMHFKIGTEDDADKMDIIFLTDVLVEYYDRYSDYHEFTIREGVYEITRPEGQTDYIADLFDEEYWTTMKYVTIKNRYDSGGGDINGTNGSGGRFRDCFYTND